jgi:hypothetical protein
VAAQPRGNGGCSSGSTLRRGGGGDSVWVGGDSGGPARERRRRLNAGRWRRWLGQEAAATCSLLYDLFFWLNFVIFLFYICLDLSHLYVNF